ncbi:FAD binding domain-containing protein [Novosphingopyxis sp.]|uniref:FAD binding domain-containing protein n=1 Tax=Novosphingopyxis sp. TaxID=2709690 RepID=UPI003B5A6193
MKPFRYERAPDTQGAIKLSRTSQAARYIGGGTNLVDLMREGVERPDLLVDVTKLSGGIRVRDDASVRIGAEMSNTALANHPTIRKHYPMLSRAILAGASAQIRNMATVGGNLLQRTRCAYFYDLAARCNKRAPGEGCDAVGGFDRNHAILGASPKCIATHPSDMCVALAALDAVVHVEGQDGARAITFADFHRLPGDSPDVETDLQPGELVTAIELPAARQRAQSSYRKVRDRASYAFALVSVAASLEIKDGLIGDVRIALGGVAHKPWRAIVAENELRGQLATEDAFRHAVELELAKAEPLPGNGFKVALVSNVIVASMLDLVAKSGEKT